jgi:hypothetical protein
VTNSTAINELRTRNRDPLKDASHEEAPDQHYPVGETAAEMHSFRTLKMSAENVSLQFLWHCFFPLVATWSPVHQWPQSSFSSLGRLRGVFLKDLDEKRSTEADRFWPPSL